MISKSLAISQSFYSFRIWNCSISMHEVMLILDCRSWLLTPDWAFKLYSPFSWEHWPWTHTTQKTQSLECIAGMNCLTFSPPCPSIDDCHFNFSTISNCLPRLSFSFKSHHHNSKQKWKQSTQSIYDSIWGLDLQSMGLCFSCLSGELYSISQTIWDIIHAHNTRDELCTKFVLASTANHLQKTQSLHVEPQHGVLDVERQERQDKWVQTGAQGLWILPAAWAVLLWRPLFLYLSFIA